MKSFPDSDHKVSCLCEGGGRGIFCSKMPHPEESVLQDYQALGKFLKFAKTDFTIPLVGLIVSGLNSGGSGLGLSPGQGHSVVFLGKTLNSHSASLHPGV